MMLVISDKNAAYFLVATTVFSHLGLIFAGHNNNQHPPTPCFLFRMAKGFRNFGISSFLLVILIPEIVPERILFLLPLGTKSHKIFFLPLINALVERNHDVSVLTNEISADVHPSVKEYLPITSEEIMKNFQDPFQSHKNGTTPLSFSFDFIVEACHKVIKSEDFQRLLQPKKFDLIVIDSFVSHCFDGFVYKSNTPFILATSMPAPSYVAERVGNFLPPSIVPVLSFRGFSAQDGEMSFLARLKNLLHFIIARVYVNYFLMPKLENVYKSYLGDDVPGIMEIESNANMIFMNSHFTMNLPKPLLPTIVEVGGIHCRKAKEIRNRDLAKFISESEAPHGFIYFSVGSIVKMDNAPEEFVSVLMKTFANLKQRVVLKWKRGPKVFENSTNPMIIPKNVLIDDWFSQQDILGHANIRLFVSHGGLLSMQEAVYHGVPVLGLPLGLDQDTNVHIAVLQGHALKMDVNDFNEESLNSSIHKLIYDLRYRENAQKISKLFRQRPVLPLQQAVFWTEFTIMTNKDNSTNYVQSPARKMNIIQYYSCDILAFLVTFLLFSTFGLVILSKRKLRIVLNLVKVIKQKLMTPNSRLVKTKIN